MKTYILLGLMQLALVQSYAQRGGGSRGDHNGGGGHNGGGQSYNGGRFNGGPSATHSFNRPAGGGNYNHYSAAPHVRGGGFYGHDADRHSFAFAGRGYYGAHPYYRGDYGRGYYGRGYGYATRVYGDHFYRNWVFGWGLGYWNPAIVWQQHFYVNLFNCYNSGTYYAPEYYNGYVSNFDRVIESINNQQYDENKMAVAKEAIQNSNITSSQTAEIMNCFANDQAKIDFAEFAYSHVSDKQNFYTVNNTFKQPDSAQQLGSYLDAQYGSHTDPGN